MVARPWWLVAVLLLVPSVDAASLALGFTTPADGEWVSGTLRMGGWFEHQPDPPQDYDPVSGGNWSSGHRDGYVATVTVNITSDVLDEPRRVTGIAENGTWSAALFGWVEPGLYRFEATATIGNLTATAVHEAHIRNDRWLAVDAVETLEVDGQPSRLRVLGRAGFAPATVEAWLNDGPIPERPFAEGLGEGREGPAPGPSMHLAVQLANLTVTELPDGGGFAFTAVQDLQVLETGCVTLQPVDGNLSSRSCLRYLGTNLASPAAWYNVTIHARDGVLSPADPAAEGDIIAYEGEDGTFTDGNGTPIPVVRSYQRTWGTPVFYAAGAVDVVEPAVSPDPCRRTGDRASEEQPSADPACAPQREPMSVVVPAVGAATAAALSIVGFGSTEAGRYAIGLFSRIRGPAVLDHGRREALYAAVRARPGVRFAELRRGFAMGNGVLAHHLSALEREGLIRRHQRGTHVHFSAAGQALTVDAALSATAASVLRLVSAAGWHVQADVARQLGLSRQAVHDHVARLRASGLVDLDGKGRVRRRLPDGVGSAPPAPASPSKPSRSAAD